LFGTGATACCSGRRAVVLAVQVCNGHKLAGCPSDDGTIQVVHMVTCSMHTGTAQAAGGRQVTTARSWACDLTAKLASCAAAAMALGQSCK
jgi:hypothetical protein